MNKRRFDEGQLVMRGDILCEVMGYDEKEKKYEVLNVSGKYAWSIGHFNNWQLKPLMHTVISNQND